MTSVCVGAAIGSWTPFAVGPDPDAQLTSAAPNKKRV